MDPVNVKRAQLLRAILALGPVPLLPLVSKEAFWTRGRHDSAQMAHLRSTQSAGKSRFPRMPTTTTHALSASPKKNLVPKSVTRPANTYCNIQRFEGLLLGRFEPANGRRDEIHCEAGAKLGNLALATAVRETNGDRFRPAHRSV